MSKYIMMCHGISRVCVCVGIDLCVKLPVRTFHFWWKTQVFIIYFPFQCTYSLFHFLRYKLTTYFSKSNRKNRRKILQQLLQCDLSEKDKILSAIHEFRDDTLIAVSKMTRLNKEVRTYRRQLACWKSHAERQTAQIASAINTEKKILRTMVAALRRLKALESSREDPVDDYLKNALDTILKFTKSCCAKEFSENPKYYSSNIKSIVKEDHLKLQRSQIDDVEKKLSASFSEIFAPFKTHKNISQSNTGCSLELIKLSMSTLDSIVRFLNTENLQLRKRLKVTNEQLEEVKLASLCVNDRIQCLESQLNNANKLLKTVESDRDMMREKLVVLEDMIDEEEVFLNYDSFGEDSYCEIDLPDFISSDHGIFTSSNCFHIQSKLDSIVLQGGEEH